MPSPTYLLQNTYDETEGAPPCLPRMCRRVTHSLLHDRALFIAISNLAALVGHKLVMQRLPLQPR